MRNRSYTNPHRLVLIIGITIMAIISGYRNVSAAPPSGVAWTIHNDLSDEFNGTSFNTAKWHTNLWYSTSSNGVKFNANNVSVSGGCLALTAKQESSGQTAGSLESYFYIPANSYTEVRAKATSKSSNVCSAIWCQVMPNNVDPNPEIDIQESGIGDPSFTGVVSTLHLWPSGGHSQIAHSVYNTGVDVSSAFHTYGMERRNNHLRLYFDDVVAWDVTNIDVSFYNLPTHMIFSQEGHLGAFNSANLPADFLIDYVRVYTVDNNVVSAPVITPNGGSFIDSVRVTLSTSTSGAIIRYTIDGTDPTVASGVYSGPFILKGSTTVKAKAFKDGLAESGMTVAAFFKTPAGGNLALGRPVTASSMENAERPAALAVDGNGATRWSSVFSETQWLQVDLQGTFTIETVVLKWEAAYGRDYLIQVSDNGTDWTTAYTRTGGTGGVETLVITGAPRGRYIRMYGTARGTQYGYSLWEFEVYGTAGSVVMAEHRWWNTPPPSNLNRCPNPVTRAALVQLAQQNGVKIYNLTGCPMVVERIRENGIYLVGTEGQIVRKIMVIK